MSNEQKTIATLTVDELIMAICLTQELAQKLCDDGFSRSQVCAAFLFASGILMRECGVFLEAGDVQPVAPYPLVKGYMMAEDSGMPCPTATAAH